MQIFSTVDFVYQLSSREQLCVIWMPVGQPINLTMNFDVAFGSPHRQM
jgi:hypothetical protein